MGLINSLASEAVGLQDNSTRRGLRIHETITYFSIFTWIKSNNSLK